MSKNSAARLQYGITKAPVRVQRVFGRPMDFDHPNITTQSWWAVDGKGHLIQANTYDGNVGRNYDPEKFTSDYPGDKEFNSKMKKGGYEEFPTEQWPAIFVPLETNSPANNSPATGTVESSEEVEPKEVEPAQE